MDEALDGCGCVAVEETADGISVKHMKLVITYGDNIHSEN